MSNEDVGSKYRLHSRYVSLIRSKKRWAFLWDDLFQGAKVPKSNKPRPRGMLVKSTLPTDTQVIIIRRILLGASLKDLADEYGLDPSVLSRVKAEKAWPYAHNKLKQINAQRLSKTS